MVGLTAFQNGRLKIRQRSKSRWKTRSRYTLKALLEGNWTAMGGSPWTRRNTMSQMTCSTGSITGDSTETASLQKQGRQLMERASLRTKRSACPWRTRRQAANICIFRMSSSKCLRIRRERRFPSRTELMRQRQQEEHSERENTVR